MAQLLSSVAGLLTAAILARALGADGFGVLGMGVAFLSFLGQFASLGTDLHGTREIARDPSAAGEIAGPIIGLRLTLAIIGYSLFLVIIYFLDRPEIEKIVLAIQGLGVFALVFTLDFIFQGLERMSVNGIRQISTSFLTLLLVVVFVNSPNDLAIAAIVAFVASVFAVAVIFIYGYRVVAELRLIFSYDKWKPVLVVSPACQLHGRTKTEVLNILNCSRGLCSFSVRRLSYFLVCVQSQFLDWFTVKNLLGPLRLQCGFPSGCLSFTPVWYFVLHSQPGIKNVT